MVVVTRSHNLVFLLLIGFTLVVNRCTCSLQGMTLTPDDEDDDEEVDDEDFPTSGKLSFKTPDLDDEHAHSQHMPDALKCDACRLLTFRMQEKFDTANKKRPSLKKNLPESEILDLFEDVCGSQFDNVGVKEIKGIPRLSGPGLETADVPGVMAGGGKWPGRLMQLCDTYVGELGEEEIYEAYKEGKLQDFVCRQPGQDCYNYKEPTKKSKKKKNKKQKSKEEL
ncbi:marginal zone B- and B1-cell-specific protein-like [Antedon mediterranea]|uniref:marginal zone B- and B1-cell-specific protein-like n=1 Tax=Antedon mediterranea TaxID=105859 RepID=UPI003AF801D3